MSAQERQRDDRAVGDAGTRHALEDRQSLEGRGLIRVSLDRKPSWQLPKGLAALGLDEAEAWDLLAELVRTVRQQGAITMPEGVDGQRRGLRSQARPDLRARHRRGTEAQSDQLVAHAGRQPAARLHGPAARRARQPGQAGDSARQVLEVPHRDCATDGWNPATTPGSACSTRWITRGCGWKSSGRTTPSSSVSCAGGVATVRSGDLYDARVRRQAVAGDLSRTTTITGTSTGTSTRCR